MDHFAGLVTKDPGERSNAPGAMVNLRKQVNMSERSPILPARFWMKCTEQATGYDTACWLWTGSTSESYGQLRVGGRLSLAHRLAYEALVAEIPDGLCIDHLCRVRSCVNPWHLDPVTQAVNTKRGESRAALSAHWAAVTHCPDGHPYDQENTYVYRGCRSCKECKRAAARRYKARRRAQRTACPSG